MRPANRRLPHAALAVAVFACVAIPAAGAVQADSQQPPVEGERDAAPAQGPSANGVLKVSEADQDAADSPAGDRPGRDDQDQPAGRPEERRESEVSGNDPADEAPARERKIRDEPEPVEPDRAKIDPAGRESIPLGSDAGLLSLGGTSDPGSESKGSDGLAGWLPEGAEEIMRTGGALATVIGVLMLCVYFVRRSGAAIPGGGRPSGVLEILARYPVGRGQRLVLLKVDRRILLLHQSGGEMSTLCEIADEDDVASLLARIESGQRERSGGRFQKALQKAGAAYTPFAGRQMETVDLTRGSSRGGLGRSSTWRAH